MFFLWLNPLKKLNCCFSESFDICLSVMEEPTLYFVLKFAFVSLRFQNLFILYSLLITLKVLHLSRNSDCMTCNLIFVYKLQQVITLYVTGALNAVLSKEHRYEICRYLYNHQVSNVHYACAFKFPKFCLLSRY